MRVPHFRFNHKGGQLQVGSGRLPLRRLRRRRGGRRPRRERAGPRPAAGQAGAPRPSARRGLPRARRQPVPQPLGRPAGGLRLRPAQPLPLLLRPLARPPDDRRRGPERRGGGRLRSRSLGRAPAARRLQLRLGRFRGPRALRGRQRSGARAAGALDRPEQQRLLLGHRRLRDPRPLAARHALLRALRVRRPLRAGRCASRSCAGRVQRRARRGWRCRTSSPSARTAAGGCTRCRSRGPCSASGAADPRTLGPPDEEELACISKV